MFKDNHKNIMNMLFFIVIHKDNHKNIKFAYVQFRNNFMHLILKIIINMCSKFTICLDV